MKKIMLVFLIIISFTACKNDTKEIDDLKEENTRLQNELVMQSANKAKYVWTVIYCKTGTFSVGSDDPKGHFTTLDKTLFWSDIEEVSNFTDDLKYKLQDDLENKCRRRYNNTLHSIQNRETYVFDTYEEASKFKYETLN